MESEKKRQTLSVVIPSVNGFPILGECLDSLTQQVGAGRLEIIVANRRADVRINIEARYPEVRILDAHKEASIPRLRAMAFQEAKGDVIAVLEDHCIVEPHWASTMLDAHRSQYPVIGGSVENAACDRLVDWAHFFCEYSELMSPFAAGVTESVPGNNVGYKRWVLDQFRPLIEREVWDCTLHEQIKNAGIPLYRLPSLRVHHKMSASLWWFMVQKFHFARSFSSIRFVDPSWLTRAAYGVGAAVLPLVLSRRIFGRVRGVRAYKRKLLLSFPMVLLLFLSWAVGEAVGYIFGPGSSHAKVS
jgi:GT2 family glycosyltransferase